MPSVRSPRVPELLMKPVRPAYDSLREPQPFRKQPVQVGQSRLLFPAEPPPVLQAAPTGRPKAHSSPLPPDLHVLGEGPPASSDLC